MAEVEVVPLQEAAGMIMNFCYEALESRGYHVQDSSVSADKLVELVQFASRDLRRISHDLPAGISREKFAAYHAFWFSKLKPVSGIKRQIGGEEVVDINERLAVLLAVEWMRMGAGSMARDDVVPYPPEEARQIGFDEPPAPLVWRKCKLHCKGACFVIGVTNYLKFHNNQNYEYLVHSLRHRAVGPYSIVNFLEAIVVTSCSSLRDATGAVN